MDHSPEREDLLRGILRLGKRRHEYVATMFGGLRLLSVAIQRYADLLKMRVGRYQNCRSCKVKSGVSSFRNRRDLSSQR
jgi:hypothetical protein